MDEPRPGRPLLTVAESADALTGLARSFDRLATEYAAWPALTVLPDGTTTAVRDDIEQTIVRHLAGWLDGLDARHGDNPRTRNPEPQRNP